MPATTRPTAAPAASRPAVPGGALDVTLHMLQRASLGRRPRGTAPVDTHTHVPGSVLRGALAAAWLRAYGPPQDAPPARRAEFEQLFEGGVRFGPLFDAGSAVVPLSVYRCKYRPTAACETSYTDQAAPADGAASPDAGRPRCPHCDDGPMVSGKGEVTFFSSRDTVADTTRTALTDEGRVAPGRLFTRRALSHRIGDGHRAGEAHRAGESPQRTLTGQLILPPDLPDACMRWLRDRLHSVRIGGDRSTSGAAELLLQQPVSARRPDPARLVRDGLLVLRLTSPALLLDAAGRPTTRLDEAWVRELLGVGVRVARSWVRQERLSGWNGLVNLPKPEELAVAAGSVYQLALDATPTTDALARLYRHGLGVRRAEGYGWLEPGTWTPPKIAAAAVPEQRDTIATGMARELYRTGMGGWFLDKLRPCAQAKREGRPVDRGFLRLRAVEGALQDERLNRLVGLLLNQPADIVEDTLFHLEAHLRGVKR